MLRRGPLQSGTLRFDGVVDVYEPVWRARGAFLVYALAWTAVIALSGLFFFVFQPYWFARLRPAIMLVRVSANRLTALPDWLLALPRGLVLAGRLRLPGRVDPGLAGPAGPGRPGGGGGLAAPGVAQPQRWHRRASPSGEAGLRTRATYDSRG